MEESGFQVKVKNVDDLSWVKTKFHLPSKLQSCHTAIVDGYVVEGHVPAQEIERLLAERPSITGLAVPGMPLGSPGMDYGSASQPYDVLAFDQNGNVEVFASY